MEKRVIDQYIGRNFAFYNGDSCEVLQNLKEESIDLSILMIIYLLAMVGGLTIISAIMMLFAYLLTTLEKEGWR